MKKKLHLITLTLIVFLSAIVISCKKQEKKKMTMATTIIGNVKIELGRMGTATVDWGDNSAKKTQTLSPFSTILYTHIYADTSSYIITATGDSITHLDCMWAMLTNLNVSNNTVLTYLNCNNNQLTNLDISNNTALTELLSSNNQLTSLDISNNIALKTLNCFNNQLTNLDVSKNTELSGLYCGFNQLTSLDVSKNTMLTSLNCSNNQLTAASLNALFETLHNNVIMGKTIYISDNPGTSTCSRNIAEAKGWIVKEL